jgi:AcrR family transcriptional regulator
MRRTHTAQPDSARADSALPARERILAAASAAFVDAGFANTSTLEIATRARVSKRELYALVGSKHDLLVACISARAARFQVPARIPQPRDRATLARALTALGTHLVREVSDPAVVGMFRLAIAEAVHAPEVARALDSIGREATRTVLRELLTRAREARLVSGDPQLMAEHFNGLLWGSLMLSLLLGVTDVPPPREAARRARAATAAFLKLY